MSCTKVLDFAPPPVTGAHLSFYWTMDEGGVADKVDSAQGLHWPIRTTGVAGAGLFSNGIHCPPDPVLTNNPGLTLFGTPAITINQATSIGIGVWFWIKIDAYGAFILEYFFDTSDPLHTNLFKLLLSSGGPASTTLELQHVNDPDSNSIDTPALSWALGTWHMVALNYDKTFHTLSIYVDGVLSVTGPDPSVYPDLTNTDLRLFNLSGPGSVLDFTVDELGMCLGAPLSPAQITALYNGGVGVTWPNITPIVPYP